MKEKQKKQVKLGLTIIKFAVLIVIIIGVPAYIFFFHREFITNMSSLENVKAYFSKYQTESILVYMAAQAVQIVISIIPGQWLQVAAGYLYGFWAGYFYSLVGAVIGSAMAYYLAKILGRGAVHLLFGEERIHEYMEKLNSKRGVAIIFIIFLIPGVPKDLCSYAAGLSDVKLKVFLIVSLIGRTPGMMGSLLIGKNIQIGGYGAAVIIGVLAVILFVLGVIFRQRVMKLFDRAYDKLMSM